MESKIEVERFLQHLKTKIEFFQISYERTRDKFGETLKKLGYIESQCTDVIKNLTYKNYYKGPKKDTIHGGEIWEFGIIVKDIEIYIKINIGLMNKPVICISFHESEYKIIYPLINK